MAFVSYGAIDEYYCLSSDIKSTTGIKTGSICFETDTGDRYIFGGSAWTKLLGIAETAGTASYLTLHNTTEEDTAGGRESRLIGKGEQSGGEITTLGYIEISHEGVADDQKGQVRIYVNDGNDGDSPSKLGMTIASTGAAILAAVTATSVNEVPINALIYSGLYNRERSDKWIQKGKVTAAHRYTLQSPAALGVYVTGKVYYISAQTDYDLSVEATWDSISTDYRVAANRAGKDFYIYACESITTTPVVKISVNSSAPSGYTTANSRKIGGFHCLCVAVGTISGHSLTGFLAGDILPDSIWDYSHRPVSSPEGMVYSSAAGIWVDIYLASGVGTTITSLYGATIKDTVDWNTFVDYGALQSKRLLWDAEFQNIALGSNEETNIAGSADPVTCGGYVDTAGRRMISNIGCEGCCGQMWQWLQDQSYQLSTLAHTHSVTVSGDPQTVTSTSTDPLPVWAWYDLPGSKGSLYRQGSYGDVKLLCGGGWNNGAHSGSRSRNANCYRWFAGADVGGRFCCLPQ